MCCLCLYLQSCECGGRPLDVQSHEGPHVPGAVPEVALGLGEG